MPKAGNLAVEPAVADDVPVFGPRPYAEALMARVGGETVGFALYFHNYSTFAGRPGVYLEDLYIRPQHRGRG